ncbi:CD151 antigen [Neocloeon triangulifer]|uniref:CD151 antigen n=1 Tax=Neocloeon triangulifer TaxID=2078957 RepID=UPI00286F2FF2|nr:CD151 antigen [Neocloeon triangulifer]
MGKGADMDGCGQFMKYSMFFSNFVIFCGGVTVLGIGVWTLADKSFINELLGTNLFMGTVYILMATGGLVALLAFFGCLGAVKEIKCLLLLYFLLVLVIFVVMLVGGILGYVFREKVHDTMEQEMQASIRMYGQKRTVTRAWDATQETLHCCGVNSYQDWGDNLPDSCCREDEEGKKLPCRYESENIYPEGCLMLTEMFVKDHAEIIGAAGISTACLLLLGMIFSCALFKSIE